MDHHAATSADTDAAALDGRVLAACASAALTVWYTRGRCGARIALSEQDQVPLGTLQQAGWLPQRHRIPWVRPRRVLGPWTGTPSLIPVPLTPAPAEDAASSTQLLGELQADQDQQLAGWLATEIRTAAPDRDRHGAGVATDRRPQWRGGGGRPDDRPDAAHRPE